MVNHHLLPCCAASRPRTQDTPAEAKLIGSRQFAYGGTKILASDKALATPSLADLFIGIAPLCAGNITSVDANRRLHSEPDQQCDPLLCNHRESQRRAIGFMELCCRCASMRMFVGRRWHAESLSVRLRAHLCSARSPRCSGALVDLLDSRFNFLHHVRR
jgi:hypothetical protein